MHPIRSATVSTSLRTRTAAATICNPLSILAAALDRTHQSAPGSVYGEAGTSLSWKTRDIPIGTKSAARTRSQALAGNVRALPREYVRLKQTQTPGTNDFATRVRVPQNAALLGFTASRHIAPNKLSSAKTNMPTEKHQIATERSFRHAAAAASTKLKRLATKARIVFTLTICS